MSDMNKPLGSAVLLTSDDIRQWQTDLQKWEETRLNAEVQIARIRQKLEAAKLLAGADFPAIEPGAEQDQETMVDAVLRVLGAASRAMPHHELQAELRKTPRFRTALDKNKGAYYYTVINRLAKRDPPVIKKAGKKIRLIHKNETPSEGSSEGASNS